jgi:Fur family transcriptional regulator, ferric uptake regulator
MMTKVVHGTEAQQDVGTVEDVLAILRARGGRVTSSRRLLLHALFDAPRDRTAEELAAEIHARAPDVNLSTVYRNLDELERLGVVLHAHLAHGPATYHLAALAHGHLVCEECGAAIEAPSDVFSSLSKTAESRFGFEIHPYHFAVPGRCQLCRTDIPHRPADSNEGTPTPPPQRRSPRGRRPQPRQTKPT